MINCKMGHIELFVNDPVKSLEFYNKVLGFELIEIQNEKFVWLSSGSYTILLRPGKNTDGYGNYQSAKSGIVLYTDNLLKTADEFKSRGLIFKGTDGSDKCLTFTDPDGNWFQLVDPNDH